jgi:ABC-type amino acid transport system permease subunit
MELKHWYQSKTIRIAIVQAVIGIVTAFISTYPELQAVGIIAVVKSFLDIALRYVSNTPII